jgi:hypothetical protein
VIILSVSDYSKQFKVEIAASWNYRFVVKQKNLRA